MFDWLEELIRATPATYPLEAASVAVDGFFPVVPGETVVITAAIVAAGGGLSVIVVFLAAWVGAFAGDNVSYVIGVKVGRPAARRLFTGNRSKRVLAWADRQLRARGPTMIVVARFVPGGRTAVTFASATEGDADEAAGERDVDEILGRADDREEVSASARGAQPGR